jgi:hypothetical protein
MPSNMESPAALAARTGFPVTDLAGASINPESNSSLRTLQAVHLSRRCAISAAMATIVAPLIFGEGVSR